jgi:hypothetical protein
MRAGTPLRFELTCRPGQVAVSAGVSRAPGALTQPDIAPIGSTGYRFFLVLTGTGLPQRVTASVACRKISGLPARSGLRVRVVTKSFEVPGEAESATKLSCPDGTTPSGVSAEVGGPLTLKQARQTTHGFSLVLANRDFDSTTARVSGSCVALVLRAGGPRLSVAVKKLRRSVRPGYHMLAASCPHGSVALGTGYGKTTAYLHSHAALATGGVWWARAYEAPARVTLLLVCGRLVSG